MQGLLLPMLLSKIYVVNKPHKVQNLYVHYVRSEKCKQKAGKIQILNMGKNSKFN